MLPRTTQQSYSAALVRESQIEPWLALANTLLAGAKSSHGTTQPKMNPQPDLRSGTKVDAAEKGLDVRKKTFLGIREKCFFLTSPFIEPGSHSLLSRHYSPPTVRPSMRIVGAATEPRNSRSLAISEILKNISFRLPATVISSRS